MFGSYRILKTLLLLLGLFHSGRSQTDRAFLEQNFCAVNGMNPDNLSCPEDDVPGINCFPRTNLCNGVNNCMDGEDEGIGVSSLECTQSPPTFFCGNGLRLPLTDLCDGVEECQLNGGPTNGLDETLVLCDNKCRGPFYGNCDASTFCDNSRNGLNCLCLPGQDLIAVPGNAFCGTITVVPLTVNEGDGNAQVCLTLAPPVRTPPVTLTIFGTFSVTVNLVGATAAANDFTQQQAQVSFSNGNLQDCIPFLINDDSTQEPTEQINVLLPASDSTGVINIIDNDMSMFAFSATQYQALESSGVLTGTIIVSNGVGPIGQATVQFTATIANGVTDPASAADFTIVTVSITFQAGAVSAPFSVTLNNDLLTEDQEQFLLTISNPSVGVITPGRGSADAFINDDDNPIVGFSPTAYQETERNGPATVFLVVTNGVSFGAGVSRNVFIASQPDASAQNQATPGSDFTAVTAGTMVSIGGPTTQFQYTLLDDQLNESPESFQLVITPAEATIQVSQPASTATITISDNDLLLVRFEQLAYQVTEGDGTIEVCVILVSGVPSNQVAVTLDPMPNTATAPSDYVDQTRTVFFNANTMPNTPQARMCTTFTIVNNNVRELNEFFTVAGSGADFQNSQSTTQITIIDDDDVIFEFTQQTYGVNENAGPAQPAIRLAAGSATLGQQQVVVQISTLSLTTADAATGFSDFTPISLTVTFTNADSNPMAVPVPILQDLVVEGTEMFGLAATISSGVATFTAGGDSASVSIFDDDSLQVAFQMPEYSMLEDSPVDQMVCLFVTSGTLAPGVSVSASISTAIGAPAGDMLATPNADYNPIPDPLTVTFTNPIMVECTDIEIVSDDINEPKESFTVNAAPVGNQISIPSPGNSAFVRICNDDLLILRFQNTDNVVPESQVGTICMDLTAGTVGPQGLAIVVESIPGGTATVGELTGNDYQPVQTTLNFQAGATPGTNDQECFFFTPINDIVIEFDETVLLRASSTNPDVQFTQAGGDMSQITIEDDDTLTVMIVPPTVGGPPNFNVDEPNGPQRVCVQVVSQPAQSVIGRPVTVTLSTMDGTAMGTSIPGQISDYCSEVFSITIEAGDENMQFCNDIDITNDEICEGPEDFSLILASADGSAMFTNSPGMVTIIDDDIAFVTTANAFSFPENVGTFDIPLALDGQKAPGRQCVVTASTMDDSAVSILPNIDYITAMETATLDADNVLVSVPIEIEDDGLCEGVESFMVFLTTSSPGCDIAPGVSPITMTIDDDEVGTVGADPHFSIVLPSGDLLCYTVQGEHGFSFNLIANKKLTMNAKFVPDSRRKEVTWIGSMGIIVRDNTYKQANATALRFEALEKKVYIGDKVELEAKNIEKMTFSNGKLMISEGTPVEGFKYPSIRVDLLDVEISFTMKFLAEHLDIFWHKTGGKLPDSHGIIGQFFRKGVEIDAVRKFLIMADKEPVTIMRRPIWSFMEREKTDDQLCWTAMNPGYQGEGLIDGSYFDYLVDDVMTPDFQFKKK